MSGFVAKENRGCSIEAISSLGTTSEISRMKKSFCGCLSGKRAISDSNLDSLYWEPQSSLYQEP